MRPVDKGTSPYEKIEKYQEAEPYLRERIGEYCSFCELPIFHVPEVEHCEAKNSGGDLTAWDNLLLGCKYCNTRKAQKIKAGEAHKWIWPDKDNTFLAYTYLGGEPKVNEEYLNSIGGDALERAKALYDGVGLGVIPQVPGNRDKRWAKRLETLGQAEISKVTWEKIKKTEYKDDQLNNIRMLAQSTGFFSIWMMIFQEDGEVRNALIAAFPGTSRGCFD